MSENISDYEESTQVHFINIPQNDRINLEGFEIHSDGIYVHIKRGNVKVQVKFDDDGVIVDMHGKDNDDGGIASCWASYDDFE
jgi:hypothetical protein